MKPGDGMNPSVQILGPQGRIITLVFNLSTSGITLDGAEFPSDDGLPIPDDTNLFELVTARGGQHADGDVLVHVGARGHIDDVVVNFGCALLACGLTLKPMMERKVIEPLASGKSLKRDIERRDKLRQVVRSASNGGGADALRMLVQRLLPDSHQVHLVD